MMPTVASMLELPLMREAEVLSGTGLLDAQRVVGISVIEVPVEDFVGRGEFVLSTAMGVGHDETALVGFVEEVAASGAAALALSPSPYLSRVPEGVTRLAERWRLPLIVLPWEVRFADVIEAVLRRVIEDQRTLKAREDSAWSLVTGDFASEELVMAKGECLGYDLRKGYVCAVGRLELNDPGDLGRATELSREVLDIALLTRKGGLRADLGAAARGDIILFARTKIPSELDPLLESISERALARGLPVPSRGVGEVAQRVRGFQRSYSQRVAMMLRP
jgi:DNA-binding PucR family transcriptional regulator